MTLRRQIEDMQAAPPRKRGRAPRNVDTTTHTDRNVELDEYLETAGYDEIGPGCYRKRAHFEE